MAKIVEVHASAHSCPFESNFVRLGLGTNTKRDMVLVRITDESGTVGLGEAHHGQKPHRDGDGNPGWPRLAHHRRRPAGQRGHLAPARASADRHPRAGRGQHHGARGHRQRALGPQGQAARAAGLSVAGRLKEAHPRLRRRIKSWLQAPGRAGRKRSRPWSPTATPPSRCASAITRRGMPSASATSAGPSVTISISPSMPPPATTC